MSRAYTTYDEKKFERTKLLPNFYGELGVTS